MTPEKFVATYYPFAKQTQDKTGINAVAIMAQCALESGWGEKCPGNMMFGVKAKKDTPIERKQLITTTEYSKRNDLAFPEIISVTKQQNGLYKYKIKDWFRKYETPEESFTDHANFFLSNQRYADALKVKEDANSFIDAIAKAGYATDPNYAGTLKSIARMIERYV